MGPQDEPQDKLSVEGLSRYLHRNDEVSSKSGERLILVGVCQDLWNVNAKSLSKGKLSLGELMIWEVDEDWSCQAIPTRFRVGLEVARDCFRPRYVPPLPPLQSSVEPLVPCVWPPLLPLHHHLHHRSTGFSMVRMVRMVRVELSKRMHLGMR